ncbi:MAG: hypothetical protein ABSE73_28295, partial [Planctomycetota bacterium]
NGLSSRESIQYQAKALPDQPPAAFLRRDDGAADAPAGARSTIVLRGEATDDLGVAKLALHYGAVGSFRQQTVDCSPPLPAVSVSRTITLDLRPLELKAGDTLECVLAAEDVKRPIAQRAQSTPLRIPIIQETDTEQESFEIGRKREPEREKAAEQAKKEAPAPAKESASATVDKLNDQAEGLMRELARLAEQGDEAAKKKIDELSKEQQELADKVVALVEKEQQDAAKNGKEEAAGKQDGKDAAEKQPDSAKNSGGNGDPHSGQDKEAAGKQSGKDNAKKQPDSTKNSGGNGEPRASQDKDAAGKQDGKDNAEKQPDAAKNSGGKGEPGAGQDKDAAGKEAAGGDKAGQGQGQGQNGKGTGQGKSSPQPASGSGTPGGGGGQQSSKNAENRNGTGAQSPATSATAAAQSARDQLAEALSELRAGEDQEEAVHKAKDALDHLFKAGRAFSAKDRQKLAEAGKDVSAAPGKRTATETIPPPPPGPAGRTRTELSAGKSAGNIIKNVPGELKEDALGQPSEKGQVKIAPEYRKALEDYYKAIAK